MRSGILRSRSLLVYLNYLHTSTLAMATYATAPTTRPHTPLLVHPNFAATYATSIQVLRNPQVVHKHVSWGILCTFIAATHEAPTPPTSFLYDQASNILHVCALQDPKSSLKHWCSLSFVCLLSNEHLLAVFVISV